MTSITILEKQKENLQKQIDVINEKISAVNNLI